MLEPNKDLEHIFEQAIQLASVNDHEYVTLEHFLYSMLNNDSFVELLNAFGADVKSLKDDVENYITNELKDIVNTEVDRPKKTNTVDRMLNRAFTQVLFSGRNHVQVIDIFLSIASETNSHASYFFIKYGLEQIGRAHV